ncbi:hypothetical protein AALO_G00100210 [Alosa alosa]|uniref:Uncharacterized protein n=1 Tax=Alosa alosa TaxID=278164 RepID=A0AAV6GTT3_9TELE|nr:hypothetical protein AALO_G00100210 [Alosa alosa]
MARVTPFSQPCSSRELSPCLTPAYPKALNEQSLSTVICCSSLVERTASSYKDIPLHFQKTPDNPALQRTSPHIALLTTSLTDPSTSHLS